MTNKTNQKESKLAWTILISIFYIGIMIGFLAIDTCVSKVMFWVAIVVIILKIIKGGSNGIKK